jgi:hypothetical protein
LVHVEIDANLFLESIRQEAFKLNDLFLFDLLSLIHLLFADLLWRCSLLLIEASAHEHHRSLVAFMILVNNSVNIDIVGSEIWSCCSSLVDGCLLSEVNVI